MAARTATASSPRATAAAPMSEPSFLSSALYPSDLVRSRGAPFVIYDMLLACSRCLSRAPRPPLPRILSPDPPVGLVLDELSVSVMVA
jgi:hypothetical protein